ncbi:hypothetical protein NDA01_23285 [Trichocoleus desertorum AS-A10]|uniref:hypothetical protein n=1 Tax=Trichocoleus desertorum TaxID=1481672 RepID=UPI003297CE7A
MTIPFRLFLSLPYTKPDRPTLRSTQSKIRNFLIFKAWSRFYVTRAICPQIKLSVRDTEW